MHSHVLNFLIIDVTKNTIHVASVFSLLNRCAVFFKKTYLRMAIWFEIIKTNLDDSQNKQVRIIGNTKWSLKQISIDFQIIWKSIILYVCRCNNFLH